MVFQEGRRGRKPEADFVCFYGPLHDRDNSLLVVEAKQPNQALPPGKAQGESYAQNLRAPLLLLTNGEVLEIWQLQISQESERVFEAPVASLAAHRGRIEELLNKLAVRDYCRSLKFKTIVEAATDFSDYETAEMKRAARGGPSIARTLRHPEAAAQPATLETTRLLGDFPSGAIVIAPSGYGKTTLSRDIFKQAVEERWRGTRTSLPFDVPLPDLEQSGIPFAAFLHKRLAAHHPGVTAPSFQMMLREFGATIFCDSFDQATPAFQKAVVTEFVDLLRDYPRVQLFIFSRAALKPNVPLPLLTLEPLSDDQVRELEKIILSDDKNAPHFSVIGMMSPTLRSLCVNPLLLRLALDHWKRNQDFPRRIELLFRSWLDALLETEPSDAVSKVQREQALTALAQAAAGDQITSADALKYLNDIGVSPAVFNELIRCNAVRLTQEVVEIQHESLADYLRAKALANKSQIELLDEIPSLAIPEDSFFPVLLMAQLQSRRLQSALWKRLAAGRIGIYLDALRYRFDVSDELRQLDPDRLSEEYLNELIDGIEIPLACFFPQMHSPVTVSLFEVEHASLAATGRASAYPGALYYKLHVRKPEQPRVTVATPKFPGTIRGVNLDLSRYRIDSGRLLGMTLLRDSLLDAVKQLDLRGGPAWAAERLIGRVRYLAERRGMDLHLTDDLDKLDSLFKFHENEWIDGDGFSGNERFSVRSLLDDIATLRAADVTALDPWWSRLGWDDSAPVVEEEVYRRVLDEEHRREQRVYAEIVRASFPELAAQLVYFPILPIRWKLTVLQREQRNSTVSFHWFPVASWEDAGADLSFTRQPVTTLPDWEAARDALVKLGRPGNLPAFLGWSLQVPYDGTTYSGHFTGATPVTNEVCSWLEDDLKHLFGNLPGSDGAF